MKYSPLFLAGLALATPVPDVDVAAHHGDGPTVVNPDPDTTTTVTQHCIHFTFDNPNWHWTKAAPWGSDSRTFGELKDSKMCVSTNNNAGGAMFIGPDANPGGGSTKLECFFPTSGSANCDVSIVDGYSLSLTCRPGGNGQVIGGGIDLWNTGACPKESGPNCINTVGPTAHLHGGEGAVSSFFQPAVKNGNHYCIWDDCGEDYYFPVTTALHCHVGGTAK